MKVYREHTMPHNGHKHMIRRESGNGWTVRLGPLEFTIAWWTGRERA